MYLPDQNNINSRFLYMKRTFNSMSLLRYHDFKILRLGLDWVERFWFIEFRFLYLKPKTVEEGELYVKLNSLSRSVSILHKFDTNQKL